MKILYPFKNSSFQNFMQNFADSLCKEGVERVEPKHIRWKLRLIVQRLKLSFNIPLLAKGKEPLIVFGAGLPDSFAFPYAYNHEIIPVLWDTWPRYHKRLIASLRRHRVKLAFFTQSQVANYVQERIPSIKCVHIPEGLNPEGYSKGCPLRDRKIDILQFGRLFNRLHQAIKDEESFKYVYQKGNARLFDSFEDLATGLADSKITICVPRNFTHPDQAGNIESLTQRYWECMFSRTIILGHAPSELLNLTGGYNPVIEIDYNDPGQQIIDILNNIGDYQDFVDRNYNIALKLAPWNSSRCKLLTSNIDQIYNTDK